MLNGIKTIFLTKSAQVEFLKESKTNILFSFKISDKDINNIKNILSKNGKYDGWHEVYGIDTNNKQCIKAKIQVYLKLRN